MTTRNLTLTALILAFSCCMTVQAETININPGEWETTTSMSIEGPFPIPPQNDVSTQCITQEDIDEGMAFMNDDETCEVTNQDIRDDGMTVTLVCDAGDAMKTTLTMEMEFDEDTMEGTMVGDMQSPMGAMKMNMTMSGKRLGDC